MKPATHCCATDFIFNSRKLTVLGFQRRGGCGKGRRSLPVADDKLIWYLKTNVISVDFDFPAGRLVQEGAGFNTLGAPAGKQLVQELEGVTGVHDVFDD